MGKSKKYSVFINILTAVAVFFVLAALYTWPLILNFNQAIFGVWGGRYGGDMFSSVYSYWLSKYLILNKLPLSHNPLVAYPFGVYGTYVFGVRTAGEIFTGFFLTHLVNEIFAYNFFIFISFVLSGLATFVLVKHLFEDFWPALIAGVIFSFSPYHLYVSLGWVELSQIYWIPLFFYCLLRARDSKRYFWGFAAGLVLFLAGIYVLYYGYFLAIMGGIYLLYVLVLALKKKEKLGKSFGGLALGLATGLILIGLAYYYQLSGSNVLDDPYDSYQLSDLILRSSRPLDFVIPSIRHPVLGGFAQKALDSAYPTFTHNIFDIFLGYTPLALALYGIKRYRHIKKKLSPYTNFSILFFIIVFLSAFILSLPPISKIGPIKVPSVSYLSYLITPMFRSISRYGVVLVSAVSVLAAFGVKSLLENKKNFTRAIIIFGIFVLIFFEFQNKDMYRATNQYETPEVYEWLKNLSDKSAIVEYPAFTDLDFRNMYYKYFQRIHQHSMMNGAAATTSNDAIRISVENILNPGAPKLLKSLGVKYVVVHDSYYQDADVNVPLPPNEIEGLRLVKRIKDDRVYEITAETQKIIILPQEKFLLANRDTGGVWWYWLAGDSHINFFNGTDEELPVVIKFDLQASAQGQIFNLSFGSKSLIREIIPLNKNVEVVVDEVLKPGSNFLRFSSEGPKAELSGVSRRIEVSFLIGNIFVTTRESGF